MPSVREAGGGVGCTIGLRKYDPNKISCWSRQKTEGRPHDWRGARKLNSSVVRCQRRERVGCVYNRAVSIGQRHQMWTCTLLRSPIVLETFPSRSMIRQPRSRRDDLDKRVSCGQQCRVSMVFYALHMGGHRNPGIEPSSPSANEVGRGVFIAIFYAWWVRRRGCNWTHDTRSTPPRTRWSDWK